MSTILDGGPALYIEMFVYTLDELDLAINDDDLTIRDWYWNEVSEYYDEI